MTTGHPLSEKIRTVAGGRVGVLQGWRRYSVLDDWTRAKLLLHRAGQAHGRVSNLGLPWQDSSVRRMNRLN